MPVNTSKAWRGSRKDLRILSVILAIVFVCSAPVIASQKITKIQVANLEDKVQIGVTATEPISYVVKESAAGAFIAFDIKGNYAAKSGRIRIGSPKIQSVRFGRFKANPATARIVLNSKGKALYNVRFLNGNKMLTIDVWKTNKRAADPVVVASTTTAADTTPAVKPTAALSLLPAKATPVSVPAPKSETVSVTPTTTPAPMASTPAVAMEVEPAVAPRPVQVATADSPARITRRAGQTYEQMSPRNISLDFVAAEIGDVLKALSVQSGANIISGSDVKGQVTVSLNKASVEEALNYVAKLSGYQYGKIGEDTYIVGNNAGSVLGTETMGNVTEVVHIAYASPSKVNTVLKELVPNMKTSGGAAGKETETMQPGGYSLLLSGSAKDVALAKDVVAKLETSLAEQQSDIVTEIYKIKYNDSTELAAMVTKVYPVVSVTAGPTTNFRLEGKETIKVGLSGDGAGEYSFKMQPDVLILSGPSADVKLAVALLKQVDLKQPQVMIEAQIVDMSEEAAKNLGLKWDFDTFIFRQNVLALDEVDFPSSTSQKLKHAPFGFKADLDAQANKGNVKILAKPKVTVLDSKVANIFIGDEIKYIINIQQTPQGANVTTETAMVGVQLRVIPKVSDENLITLNIHPEVSVITDFLTVNGLSIALPQISRRFTDSTVRIKDGQTIVIGGLIKDSEIKNLQEVPLLSKIPFFGELFKHRSTTKQKSEVTIFITARLVQE